MVWQQPGIFARATDPNYDINDWPVKDVSF